MAGNNAKPQSATDYGPLRQLLRPHIESFDYFVDQGMEKAVLAVHPVEIYHKDTKLRIYFERATLFSPVKKEGKLNDPIFPHECRTGRTTYKGEFKAEVALQYDTVIRETFSFGHIRINI